MRNFITILVLVFSLPIFAQSHIIVKHIGNKIPVNYIKISNNLIYYTTGQTQEEYSISTFAVAELIDKSTNAVTKVTDKVIVNGVQDYKKVVLIDEDQTKGLTAAVNELRLNSWAKGQDPFVIKNQNVMVLKKKASKEGIPFVLLTGKNRTDSIGKMYTY